MVQFPKLPSGLTEILAIAGGLVVIALLNWLIPEQIRSVIYAKVQKNFRPPSSNHTIVVDEFSGITRNEVYDAAVTYLRTKISHSTDRFKVKKTLTPSQESLTVEIEKGQEIASQECFTVEIEKGQEIVDDFNNVKYKWRLVHQEPDQGRFNSREKRFFELVFKKKYRNEVLNTYLPHVLATSNKIKKQKRAVTLYTRDCKSYSDQGGCAWESVYLQNPATFQTIAMDQELKNMITDDLTRFVRRKDHYVMVRKARKRGYLLYGPSGCGKSALIAAMADYLKFDIYDLELTSLHSISELRCVLLSMPNQSILVIEDIDCGLEVFDRQYAPDSEETSKIRVTQSGLLNNVDGLLSSCCADERIIIFTAKHKDRLDPALLRPGRMDMHIHMSYCTPSMFRDLARAFLVGARSDMLDDVARVLENTEVTPAEVMEEFVKNDTANEVLAGLLKFIQSKRT